MKWVAVLAAAGLGGAGLGVATTLVGNKPLADSVETGPASDVYYEGCNEVRAAGLAPLHRNQPGYRSEMDGDGDGIACEPHRDRFG